jgi:hypothetical protein
MASTVTLRQRTEITTENKYRVIDEVTAATGIGQAVFVFKVSDDSFSHYATVADMVNYPDNKADAKTAGIRFYRQATATRDWDSIELANSQKQTSQDRINILILEWDNYNEGFVADETVVISGE